jgi:hydrogenase maturation protease
MAQGLVIGYGNPMRRDDGVGWQAVEELSRELPADLVDCISVRQLSPELAERLSALRAVIFVKAHAEGEPGSLECRRVEPRPHESPLLHELDPPGLLAIAKALYGANPKAAVVSVAGESFEHGNELSPPVEAALPDVVVAVRKLLGG